jgi:hypothetical protein
MRKPVLDPDSVFVRTATEVLLAHRATPGATICPACGADLPCPPARNAFEVRLAAGLPGDPMPSGPTLRLLPPRPRRRVGAAIGRAAVAPSALLPPGNLMPEPLLPEPLLPDALLPAILPSALSAVAALPASVNGGSG